MKRSIFILTLFIIPRFLSFSQVSVSYDGSPPDPSAMLDVKSSNKGILLPRITDTNAVAVPAKGLVVFDLSKGCIRYYNGTSWSGCLWVTCEPPSQPSVIAGQTSLCAEHPGYNYTVTNTSGVSYTWTVPAGWSITNGQGTNSITATSGNTSGNITVTPSNNCRIGVSRSLAISIDYWVPSQPSPINGPQTPCQNTSGINYSVTNVSGVVYTWSVPAGWSITVGQYTNMITVTTGEVADYITVTPSTSCGDGPEQTLYVQSITVPSTPSVISGPASPCQNTSGLNYSVNNVSGVTYSWVVPSGWSITSGQGTNSVTVTSGTASGNIVVTPSNPCGNGPNRTKALTTVPSIPSQPSAISGQNSPCQNTSGLIYSVGNVNGVTYTWTVPTGWSITVGQGTNSITTTSGTASGTIAVTPSNACGNGTASTLAVNASACNGSTCSFTFTYNTVSAAGYTWLDRNLGASRVAQSSTDYYAYGSLFQWARYSDGHECINWSGSQTGSGVNGVTTTQCSGTNPTSPCANSKFVYNWQNWTTVGSSQNTWWNGTTKGSADPCPTGYRVPSMSELDSLSVSFNPGDITGAYNSPLRMPAPGERDHTNALITNPGTYGYYWSSSYYASNVAYFLYFYSGGTSISDNGIKGNGYSVRCISDCNIPSQPSPVNGNAYPCANYFQYTYSVTNVGGVTYAWTVPSGWSINSGQGTNAISVTSAPQSGNIIVTPSNSCGTGTSQSLAVTTVWLPDPPSPISGPVTPCQNTAGINYSVINVAGNTYYWSVPSGWSITAGTGTNSITVTTGTASGTISVYPGNSCGGNGISYLTVTITPGVPSQPSAISGPASPCQNTSGLNYSVTSVNGIAYTWSVPSGWSVTAGQGTNSVTVTSGTAAGNIQVTPSNSCGNGTPRTKAVTTVPGVPSQPSAITGQDSPCQSTSGLPYSVTNVSGVTYTWAVPSGWSITAGQGTNSITVTSGTTSGTITVTPSNVCGNGAASTLAVTAATCNGSTCSFTFTYNTVSAAGYTWLDRNLGASRVAQSSADYYAYGSMFQWARYNDGHECINWTGSQTGTGVNGVTTTQCSGTNPTAPCGNNKFVYNHTNWTTQSSSQQTWWNGTSKGPADPCPSGYRVPSQSELDSLSVSFDPGDLTGAYNSSLRMPAPGERDHTNAVISDASTYGYYWSSTYYASSVAYFLYFYSGGTSVTDNGYKGNGYSVRCISE